MNTTPSSTLHFTSTTASDRPRSDQDQPQVDATRRVRAAGERALVLGGGGSAGNAWLIGVIAGLFDAGLDVTEADLIIGTSAGSTAAAQITSATPTELLAAILAAAPQQRTGPVGSDGGRVPIGPVADHMERTSRIIAAAEDAADMRRRMGAAALEMDAASDGSGQTRWRATVAARLPSQHWPQRTVLITAVDAHTGEPVVFDRHSGVDLVDAVAASTVPVALPTASATADTSTAATDATRMPIWQPDTGGCWCCHHFGGRSRHAAGLGHASCSTGRRTTRTRQQSRNDLPGQRLRARVRRQSDGSVDASARRSSRLRPRQSPCRAAHRVLALTPTKPVDSVGVTTPAHASDGRGARQALLASCALTWARSAVLTLDHEEPRKAAAFPTRLGRKTAGAVPTRATGAAQSGMRTESSQCPPLKDCHGTRRDPRVASRGHFRLTLCRPA